MQQNRGFEVSGECTSQERQRERESKQHQWVGSSSGQRGGATVGEGRRKRRGSVWGKEAKGIKSGASFHHVYC